MKPVTRIMRPYDGSPPGMPKAKRPAKQRRQDVLDQHLAVTRRAPGPVTHLPEIKMPWTKTSDLSANSRLHWRKRHALVKAQKRTADALAREAGWHKVRIPDDAKISINLTFCPPSRGPVPDLDNALTAQKGALDALAAVLGVNDRRFRISIQAGDRCRYGAVIVRMEVGLRC